MAKSDAALISTIEKETYNTADLVTFKFSAKQLPYYTNSKNYEAANGEVDVNGVSMQYVKKRIVDDSIEYVCLPNKQKSSIKNARDDFFKLINDLQNTASKTSSKNNTKTYKAFSFEAVNFQTKNNITTNIIFQEKNYTSLNNKATVNPFLLKLIQPPDVA